MNRHYSTVLGSNGWVGSAWGFCSLCLSCYEVFQKCQELAKKLSRLSKCLPLESYDFLCARVFMKFSLKVHEKFMKSYFLNSFLQCHEVFQKRLELSRKFLICQNVCLLYDLAFVLEIHLYIERKLVRDSIWTFFLVAT